MADITIVATDKPDYHGTVAPLLRAVYDTPYTADDGTVIGGLTSSLVYREVQCTLNVSTHVLTIPTFVIKSTEDGKDVRTSTISFYLFNPNGKRIGVFGDYKNLRVPASIAASVTCSPMGTCCSFSDLAIYNNGAPRLPEATYYDARTVDQKILAQAAASAGIHDPGTNGLLVRTALNTVTPRTITGSANISVSNGGGISGNPVLDLPDSGASAGSYTSANITINAKGIVTVAANGAGSGYTDPLTTQGDIVYRNSGTTARLARGAANTVLQSNGTTILYAAVPDAALSANVPLLNAANHFTASQLFGTGTPYAEGGIAGLGATSLAFNVAVGSAASPSSSTVPVISIQKQDSASGASATFLYSLRKQSGSGFAYGLYAFVRQESPDVQDAVAITGSIYVAPTSTPGGIQTNWGGNFRAERATTGTRVSATEFTVVNSTDTDASHATGNADATFGLNIAGYGFKADGTTQPTVSAKNTAAVLIQTGNPNTKGGFFSGVLIDSNSVSEYGINAKPIAGTSISPLLSGNATYLAWRNAADNADILAFGVDGSNATRIRGDNSTDSIIFSSTAGLTYAKVDGASGITTPFGLNGPIHNATPIGTLAGQTGEMRMLELAANGSSYVGFKAPDSLSASKVWVMPSADGTANQVLKTDGAGNLSWAANLSGGAPVSDTYILLSQDTIGLPNSRVLQGTAGQITLTDSGAGGNCTLSIPAAATITTSLTVPTLYGGSSASSTVKIEGTSSGSPVAADIYLNGAAGFAGAPSAGRVVIGSYAPGNYRLDIQGTDVNILRIMNTNAVANAGSAGIQAGVSVLPLTGGRVAFYSFGAASGVANNLSNGAIIEGLATENWAIGTNQGMSLRFGTTPAGSATRATRWTMDDTGNLISAGRAFASLGTPADGSYVYCTDAKDVAHDGAVAGSVAASGGGGAWVFRQQSAWRIFY